MLIKTSKIRKILNQVQNIELLNNMKIMTQFLKFILILCKNINITNSILVK